MVEVWSMHNPTIREIFIINKARTFQPVEEEQALHNGVKLFLRQLNNNKEKPSLKVSFSHRIQSRFEC